MFEATEEVKDISVFEVVKTYKEGFEKVHKIYNECTALLARLRSELSGKDGQEMLSLVDMDALHKAMANFEIKGSCAAAGYTNPCIAIVGQTKAGKSTVINTLLKKKIVTQAETKCTARVTHLYYSEQTRVDFIKPDGTTVFSKKLKKSSIPSSYLGLNDKQRKDPNMTGITIRAGCKSEFLQQGIDIIDSPGLNENETLNDLSHSMMESLLPMLIYVIDGNMSLTESDIANIERIKKTAPNLQIVYFITKLDSDEYDKRDHPERDPIEHSVEKLDKTYKKLQRHYYVPQTTDRARCGEFHGASLWLAADYRKNKKIDPETEFNAKMFLRFEASLQTLIKCHLESTILEAVSILVVFLQSVLEKIMNRARLCFFDSKKLKEDVKIIKVEEQSIYKTAMKLLSDSGCTFQEKVIEMLKNKKDSILDVVYGMCYKDIEIPEDGILDDTSQIAKCQKAVHEAVIKALDAEIRMIVQSEIYESHMKVREELQKDISRLSQGDVGKTSFRKMLESLLLRTYELDGITSSENQKSALRVIGKIFKKIVAFFKSIFINLHEGGEVNVKHPDWKRKQASNIFSRINPKEFAEYVCSVLTQDIEQMHRRFGVSIRREEQDLDKNIEISGNLRACLIRLAPEFAIQFMYCLDVRSKYQLTDLKETDKIIGRGSQGCVMLCEVAGREMAMKKTFPSPSLGQSALEIYYHSILQHPRLLKLYGVRLKFDVDGKVAEIHSFTDRMKWDAAKWVRSDPSPSFTDRLKLAVQVAGFLEYLHDQDIMHRDLKLANILLDENQQGCVADYGSLKCVGMSLQTLAGTPIHIAPEILEEEPTIPYDVSVDIYSFGIFLWYLLEGTGRHPDYTREFYGVRAILMAAKRDNRRPERLEGLPDKLWELMTQCWSTQPSLRPKIQDVRKRLKSIMIANGRTQ